MDHKVSKDMISSGMIPSGEKTQADLGRTQYGSAPSPNKLMDAYKSMYEKKEEVINEHHKKDADGNTIPHEGEEINEALPLVPFAVKSLMALKNAKFLGSALKGASAFKKGLMTKKAVNVTGNVIGGTKKVGMAQKAGQATRSGFAAMKNNPVNTALAGTMAMPRGGPVPQRTGGPVIGQYNDVDLFDLVKGQLLDEGIDEKDALKIMVELSQEDLNIIVNEGLVGNIARITAAGTVAAMGADAINKQLQNKKKMEQGGKFKKGGIMDTIQKKNQMMQGM